MEPIRTLDQLVTGLKNQPSKRLVVAAGHDPHGIQAAARAAQEDIAVVTLIGKRDKVKTLCKDFDIDPSVFTIIDEQDDVKAAAAAVRMVKAREADVLMKGMVGTDLYVKQILDKEKGLLPAGNVLTHLAVLEIPAYQALHHKLLFVSDVAIIPAPDLDTKAKILRYCVDAAHSFGVALPRAAILSANEKVSVKIPSTTDAAILTQMAAREQIKGVIVDGPLALDGAISPEACRLKGLRTPIEGAADILIFPSLEAGNIFYKAATILGGAQVASVLVGTSAPCVLTSRADTEDSKFLSIALGCRLAAGKA